MINGLGDTDAETYKNEPMKARWDNIKKNNHNKYCNYQQKHFSLVVLSVDGFIGREALVMLYQLSLFMAEKTKKTLSQVQGWVNG